MSFLTILQEEQSFTGKDGKEYKLAPLTLRDLGKFVSWVKFKPYREAVEQDLPRKELDRIYEDCKRGKVKEEIAEGEYEEYDIHIQSSIVLSAMSSIEGAIKLFELSMQKHHPDVLFDEVCDEDTLTKIQDELLKLNFGLEEEEPEKNLKDPNQ